MLSGRQNFNSPVIEVIKNRRSVRTYRPEALSDDVKKMLRDYAAGITGPFAPKVRLELVESAADDNKAGGKIGTYGVIKGAQDFIAGIVETGEMDFEQFGYVMEKLILYATSLGLGTCWLGGTFKKNEIVKMLGLRDKEVVPAISPVGYPADKESAVEALMRFAAGSKHRKPWQDLFYIRSSSKAEVRLTIEYTSALEAVRLAPSASNKQPWRIIKNDGDFHFYVKPSKGYAAMQRIDMGIAMCHFEMVLQEYGITGSWVRQNPGSKTAESENLNYIVSWFGPQQA